MVGLGKGLAKCDFFQVYVWKEIVMERKNLIGKWERALFGRAELSGEEKVCWREAIRGMLRWCERRGKPVCRESGREYYRELVSRRKAEGRERERWGMALKWFFDEIERSNCGEVEQHGGKRIERICCRAGANGMEAEIPVEYACISNEWERALVKAARENHLMLRTEQAYRGWAKRYLAWLPEGNPREVSALSVGDFLSDLVVRQKVAPATQKQALNALAFFWREVMKQENADFGQIERGPERRRIPTVLTREEIRRLLANLSGHYRLMASMAYGGGLRVNELLRLRMKDVDPDRKTITVRAGKGDRDRVTPLAMSLVPEVRLQQERVREVHRRDREAGVPGVYLPEALARKYPSAGVSLAWMWFFPAPKLMNDPRSGLRRRHHILDATFQMVVRRAAEAMGTSKRVTPQERKRGQQLFA
jgi:integron integrase